MVQLQFRTQPVGEGIPTDQSGSPTLVKVEAVDHPAVLSQVLRALPVDAALNPHIGTITGARGQRSRGDQ